MGNETFVGILIFAGMWLFSTWVTKLTKRLKANPDYRQPGDFLLESLCEGKQSDSEKLKSFLDPGPAGAAVGNGKSLLPAGL